MSPIRILAATVVLALGASTACAQTAVTPATPSSANQHTLAQPGVEKMRSIASAYVRGDTDAVWRTMTPDLQLVYGTSNEFDAGRDELTPTNSLERRVIDESYDAKRREYKRVSQWTGASSAMVTRIFHDDEGRVTGFSVKPLDTTSATALAVNDAGL